MKILWNWKTSCISAGVILLVLTWTTYMSRFTNWQLGQSSSQLGYHVSEGVTLVLNTDETTTILSTHPVFETFPGYKLDSGGILDDTLHTVQRRLRAAEWIWARSNAAKNQALKTVKLQNGIDYPQYTTLWDLFYPSFDCPFVKERIGRVGDGGKWICGFELLQSKSQCTMFSFGISGDTSFEEEFLRRTNSCVVHMFDPTITSVPAVVAKYPYRAFFHFQGIGPKNENEMGTLKTIMDSLSVKVLDVLKMDVEGAEWGSMDNMFKDFPQGLPFAQIQIEVHLGPPKEQWLSKLSSWFVQMESAGLRQFFQEPNLFTYLEPIYLRELAFVNVKMHPFKLIR